MSSHSLKKNFPYCYMRNSSSSSVGVFGYIDVIEHMESSPEISQTPPAAH